MPISPTSRRAAPAGAARPARRPVTGRALVLGAVVVLLVVLLASPLHRYVSARAGLAQADQQRSSDQQQLSDLQAQERQLQDPAYIAQQARLRLQYALPGDTVYTVLQPGQQPGVDESPKTPTGDKRAPGDTWNRRLWGSLQAADSSP
jgi:cell division protein FtsB